MSQKIRQPCFIINLSYFCLREKLFNRKIVGSVVEWLKCWACDQHSLGSKPTHAILLCPWERHFTALSRAWWSWQAVLNYSHISIKLQVDSNTWHLQKQVGVIAYPMYEHLRCFPASQEDKYKDEIKIKNKNKKNLIRN